MIYDVVVVGAGPSGLMAAIQARLQGASVCLLEKNSRVGKKLLMTGGGRCNVTNNKPFDELISHIPTNPKFLYSSLSRFSAPEIIDFFQSIGVSLKEEDHGRMFPEDDSSKTIVSALLQQIYDHHISLFFNEKVEEILIENWEIQGVRTDGRIFHAKNVVLSTGGCSYTSTGSTGDGYKLAKSLGHRVTPLLPSESPLVSKAEFIQKKILQGLSLRDVECKVLKPNGKVAAVHQNDLLFTHFGLSGPAALRCSTFVNGLLRKGEKEVRISINLFPHLSKNVLEMKVRERLNGNKKSVKNALKNFIPERLLLFFLEQSHIPLDKEACLLTNKEVNEFLLLLQHFVVPVVRTFPLEKSFVTKGGIPIKEINPKTMESKIQKGLYFTGEVIDVNAYTGGYNITIAFSTGASCGMAIGEAVNHP